MCNSINCIILNNKKNENNNSAVPAMSGEDILKYTSGIENIADIHLLDFGMMPGPHMTPEKCWNCQD